MVARGNVLESYKYVLISLKMYSKGYSSQCSKELKIVVHWKWYKTPINVWQHEW